ncbi:MAG: Usg family protein [Pseudomonadota bacterium]
MRKRLRGYSLATAQIYYRLPDYPELLQTFLWQQFDLAPDYPELRKFLDFWSANIDGELHSVEVASAGLFRPSELRFADGVYNLH